MIMFCTYQIPLNIFLVDWCPCCPIKCGVQQHHIRWWEVLYSYYSNPQWPVTPLIVVVWITRQVHWGTCTFPWAPFSSICHVHSHHITSTELKERKGINCTLNKPRSCKMQCPHLTAQSPYSVPINTNFLNKCYSSLPFS